LVPTSSLVPTPTRDPARPSPAVAASRRGGAAARLGVLLALLLQAGQAIAQSPACTQIRAELAGLGGGVTRDSQRLRTELARVRYAIQQNDCERRGFLFFNNPPPVCAPLRAQAAQLAAQIGQMEGGGSRRAQLLAALDRYPYGCTEQTVSRAMPLLYVNRLASMEHLALDDAAETRIAAAIARATDDPAQIPARIHAARIAALRTARAP